MHRRPLLCRSKRSARMNARWTPGSMARNCMPISLMSLKFKMSAKIKRSIRSSRKGEAA